MLQAKECRHHQQHQNQCEQQQQRNQQPGRDLLALPPCQLQSLPECFRGFRRQQRREAPDSIPDMTFQQTTQAQIRALTDPPGEPRVNLFFQNALGKFPLRPADLFIQDFSLSALRPVTSAPNTVSSAIVPSG